MTALGSWGEHQSYNNQQQEVEALGSWLSSVIGCPIRYPAYGKNVFECRCGVLFPLFVVKAQDSGAVTLHHRQGFRPTVKE